MINERKHEVKEQSGQKLLYRDKEWEFIYKIIPDDGDCGFRALGMTRAAGVKLLLDNLGDKKVCEYLGREIYAQFSAGNLPRVMRSEKDLIALQSKSELSGSQRDQELVAYFQRPAVVESYIKSYLDVGQNGWLDYQSLTALAYLNKTHLIIYREKTVYHDYAPAEPQDVKIIIATHQIQQDTHHFDRLEPVETKLFFEMLGIKPVVQVVEEKQNLSMTENPLKITDIWPYKPGFTGTRIDIEKLRQNFLHEPCGKTVQAERDKILKKIGDFDRYVSAYNAMISQNDETIQKMAQEKFHVTHYDFYANALLLKGDYSGCLALANQLATLDKEKSHVIANKAKIQQQLDGEIIRASEKINHNQTSAALYYARAKAWHCKGFQVEAILDTTAAIELSQNQTIKLDSYLLRATSWKASNNNKEAYDDTGAIINIEKNWAAAYVLRAELCYQSEEYEAAMKEAKALVAISPGHEDFFYQLSIKCHLQVEAKRLCQVSQLHLGLNNLSQAKYEINQAIDAYKKIGETAPQPVLALRQSIFDKIQAEKLSATPKTLQQKLREWEGMHNQEKKMTGSVRGWSSELMREIEEVSFDLAEAALQGKCDLRTAYTDIMRCYSLYDEGERIDLKLLDIHFKLGNFKEMISLITDRFIEDGDNTINSCAMPQLIQILNFAEKELGENFCHAATSRISIYEWSDMIKLYDCQEALKKIDHFLKTKRNDVTHEIFIQAKCAQINILHNLGESDDSIEQIFIEYKELRTRNELKDHWLDVYQFNVEKKRLLGEVKEESDAKRAKPSDALSQLGVFASSANAETKESKSVEQLFDSALMEYAEQKYPEARGLLMRCLHLDGGHQAAAELLEGLDQMAPAVRQKQ